jgi:hypothetical protein
MIEADDFAIPSFWLYNQTVLHFVDQPGDTLLKTPLVCF